MKYLLVPFNFRFHHKWWHKQESGQLVGQALCIFSCKLYNDFGNNILNMNYVCNYTCHFYLHRIEREGEGDIDILTFIPINLKVSQYYYFLSYISLPLPPHGLHGRLNHNDCAKLQNLTHCIFQPMLEQRWLYIYCCTWSSRHSYTQVHTYMHWHIIVCWDTYGQLKPFSYISHT